MTTVDLKAPAKSGRVAPPPTWVLAAPVAAVFTVSAATKAAAGLSGSLDAVGLVAAVVEVILAAWLVLGVRPRAALLVTAGVLAVFMVVGVHRTLTGVASCGCFGDYAMRPWVTATYGGVASICILANLVPATGRRTRLAASALAALAAAGLLGSVAASAASPRPATAFDVLIAASGIAADSPDRVGVVAVSYGCHDCAEFMQEARDVLPRLLTTHRLRGVVLLDVGHPPAPRGAYAAFYPWPSQRRLDGAAGGFVTPALHIIEKGVVIDTIRL